VIIDRGRAIAAGTPSQLKRRLGGDIVEVHVRSVGDLPRVAELLGRLDHHVAQIDETTRRVSVRVETGGEGLMRALRSVHDAGVEIEDIAMRQPNLDEVFLSLTEDAAQAA
jgi:ABC-2 type transport system ATP-binding protein